MFNNQMSQTSGYCQKCNSLHTLPAGNTEKAAQQLVKRLQQVGSINIFAPDRENDATLSLDALFGKAGGKMFGIAEVLDKQGKSNFLYAFSGQYNGRWLVPGWVPPPFDTKRFYAIYNKQEPEIKAVGREMENLPQKGQEWQLLRKKRRQLSRRLNAEVQALCHLHNSLGEEASLPQIFGSKGIPTGTGECCTPKLLDYAAKNGLIPVGLCEFFIGSATRSGSCQHGYFYAPCKSKCQPLLGFMLCGL